MNLSEIELKPAVNMEESRRSSTANLTEPTGGGGNSLPLLLLVVVIGLVSVVSIIVAAVALSRPAVPNVSVTSPDVSLTTGGGSQPVYMGGASNGVSSGAAQGIKKTWTISVGHDYGAHEYIDEKGYLRGFSYDVIREVCAAAGIDCRTMWDRYDRCWDSRPGTHATGGSGILGYYYDGCMGWYTTIDRIHVLAFSQAYLNPPMAFFYVKKGNPNSRSASDINGLRVGFIEGWASDEKCVARLPSTQVAGNYPIPSDSIFHYEDATTMAEMLASGTIDIAFATEETMEKFLGNQLEIAPGQPSGGWQCLLAGNALMARKDSPLIGLFNDGLQKLRASGRLGKLCEEGVDSHGVQGSIDCIGS